MRATRQKQHCERTERLASFVILSRASWFNMEGFQHSAVCRLRALLMVSSRCPSTSPCPSVGVCCPRASPFPLCAALERRLARAGQLIGRNGVPFNRWATWAFPAHIGLHLTGLNRKYRASRTCGRTTPSLRVGMPPLPKQRRVWGDGGWGGEPFITTTAATTVPLCGNPRGGPPLPCSGNGVRRVQLH
jgi:hypothetical protein